MDHKPTTELEKAAMDTGNSSLVGEFWYFLRETRKWWLLPIITILLLFGLFLLLTATGAAPFIYTLF